MLVQKIWKLSQLQTLKSPSTCVNIFWSTKIIHPYEYTQEIRLIYKWWCIKPISFCAFSSGYYKSLYILVNHRLPSSLEYTDAPSIPLASTLLEHILKPLHFTYSSCTTGARYNRRTKPVHNTSRSFLLGSVQLVSGGTVLLHDLTAQPQPIGSISNRLIVTFLGDAVWRTSSVIFFWTSQKVNLFFWPLHQMQISALVLLWCL